MLEGNKYHAEEFLHKGMMPLVKWSYSLNSLKKTILVFVLEVDYNMIIAMWCNYCSIPTYVTKFCIALIKVSLIWKEIF